MATDDPKFLKEFYQALRDRALEPDDPAYVELYADRELAPTDPIRLLQTTIEWSPLESAQLFSGFRGTGKSTELKRLRHELGKDPDNLVVLCDMQDYLNLTTPVDISDFLLALAGAFSDALDTSELLGVDPKREGYWARFYHFMTRTNVELTELGLGVEAGVGGGATVGGDVKANLKADPSFRARLQQRLKGHLGALVADVRAFVQSCVEQLQKRHGASSRVVLLLDSVEQIRGTVVNAEEVASSLVVLFHGHADKLRIPYLHVVYTIPPWLKIKEPGLASLYDNTAVIPCVKVRDRHGDPCQGGLDTLERVVRQRGDWERLLGDRAALDAMLLASGGYLRDLFRLLQQALLLAPGHALPLSGARLELARSEVRSHYLPVSNEDAEWLERIDRSRHTELEDDTKLPDLARYFDNLLVMAYRNGDGLGEWWAVHPLLVEAVRHQAAAVRERREANRQESEAD